MANGQTILGGGFDPRFRQAPISSIPDETVGPGIGSGKFFNVRPPEKPDIPSMSEEIDLPQLLKSAKDVVARMQFDIEKQVTLQQRGAPIDLKPFLDVVIPQFERATEIYGDALEANGQSRLPAERNLALLLGRLPQMEVTFTTIKADERRLREQGGVSKVAVPASQIIPQGAVQSIGGVASVRGQPTPGPAPKIKAVFDTTTKQPRFASEQEILASNGRLQPLPTGFEIKTNPDGSVTILSGTRRGEDKEGKSRERLVSIQNMARRALSLIDIVEKGGADVLATSGFLSQLKSGFDAQAKSIAKKFGLSLNTESFDFPGLSEDAVNARLIKSAVLDLAIMKAQAIGLGSGRALSDKDIQQQINTLSGGFGDPNVVIANIKQAVANVALDFQQRRRILFDDQTFDIRSNLGPGSEVFFNEQEVNAPQGATRIEDLPDGTVVVQNGIRFVIQDGQAVPQ